MKLRALLSFVAVVVVSLAASGCGTVCIVGVREAAAVQCKAGESWETCLPKVEAEVDRAQAKALELLKTAAAGK